MNTYITSRVGITPIDAGMGPVNLFMSKSLYKRNHSEKNPSE
jgi:hypothetical protein